MSIKTTTINYFQIVPKDADLNTCKSVQEKLRGLENKKFKMMELSGKSFTIPDPLKKSDTYQLGTIFEIQMGNIPPSMNKNTLKVDPLKLEDTDGLAKATCFLLDVQANILVIESNAGVSAHSLCQYFRFNSDLPRIVPAIIINPDLIQQFYKMGSLFSFEAKMAKINDGSLFSEGENSSIDQILQSADETDTDKLTYKLEIGPENKRENKSLNKEKILNFTKRLLQYKGTEEVESLKVSGRVGIEEKITTLELIKQRLNDQIEYEIEDRLITKYNLEDRYAQIEGKYAKHREYLLRTYKIES